MKWKTGSYLEPEVIGYVPRKHKTNKKPSLTEQKHTHAHIQTSLRNKLHKKQEQRKKHAKQIDRGCRVSARHEVLPIFWLTAIITPS
jgi:hypothetical protein